MAETRYLMESMRGNRHWLTETACAHALDGPWIDCGVAMDIDDSEAWIERPLTEAEKRRITQRSNEISGNK